MNRGHDRRTSLHLDFDKMASNQKSDVFSKFTLQCGLKNRNYNIISSHNVTNIFKKVVCNQL